MGSKKERGWPLVDEIARLPHPLTDNHTHLPVPADTYEPPGGAPARSAEELVDAAAHVGVRRIITSACELPTMEESLDLARQLPGVRCALAIHPNEAVLHAGVREIGPDGLEPKVAPHHGDALDDALARLEQLCRDYPAEIVAVGETGIDLFRTGPRGRDVQIESFRAHIALAKERGLPLQIHDRDAHADVIAVLLADGAPERTVFHCFSGDVEMARLCAEHGWFASIAGPITYPANEALRAAVLQIPDELLLIETDAPYLSPVPFRGRPHGSYVLPVTAAYMASMRGCRFELMCERLERTTESVYGVW